MPDLLEGPFTGEVQRVNARNAGRNTFYSAAAVGYDGWFNVPFKPDWFVVVPLMIISIITSKSTS